MGWLRWGASLSFIYQLVSGIIQVISFFFLLLFANSSLLTVMSAEVTQLYGCVWVNTHTHVFHPRTIKVVWKEETTSKHTTARRVFYDSIHPGAKTKFTSQSY